MFGKKTLKAITLGALLFLCLRANTQTWEFSYDENGNQRLKNFENCNLQNIHDQNVFLEKGWNLTSTFIQPQEYLIGSVFTSLDANLLKVKNLLQSYDPNLTDEFNTLRTHEDGAGYWVQVADEDTWTISGTALNPSETKIELKEGWNLIGYTCPYPQSPESAYSSIMNDLEKVKNISESYDPTFDPVFNSLTQVMPGQGYWVKMKSKRDFYYPCVEKSKSAKEKSGILANLPKHWIPRALPNSTISYGEVTLNGQPLTRGCIGAFIENECRAIAEVQLYEGKSYVSLVINGTEKEKVEFRLLQDDLEYISAFNWHANPGNYSNEILPLQFGVISSSEKEQSIQKIKVFPNPFRDDLFIELSLKESSGVTIELFSVTGQIIFQKFFPSYPSGKTNLKLEGINGQLEEGIYVLKVQSNNSIQVKKIIKR